MDWVTAVIAVMVRSAQDVVVITVGEEYHYCYLNVQQDDLRYK